MKVTQIEISLEWEDSSEFEHEGYFDNFDDAIRYLKKIKKQYQNGVDEDDLLETLYSYEGKVFDNLYLISDGTIVDHSHQYGPWWYTKDRISISVPDK